MNNQVQILEKALKQKLSQEQQAKVKPKSNLRKRNPHKMVLSGKLEELPISVELCFNELNSKDIDQKLVIISRDKETGHRTRWTNKPDWFFMDMEEEGKRVSPKNVEYFQLVNDEEVSVKPFSKSKVLEILGVIPRDDLKDYLVEGLYEMWVSEPEKGNIIRALIKKLSEMDSMIKTKFTFGRGFKEYYGIIYPQFNVDAGQITGKYTLVMAQVRKRLEFEHWASVEPELETETKQTNYIQSALPEI